MGKCWLAEKCGSATFPQPFYKALKHGHLQKKTSKCGVEIEYYVFCGLLQSVQKRLQKIVRREMRTWTSWTYWHKNFGATIWGKRNINNRQHPQQLGTGRRKTYNVVKLSPTIIFRWLSYLNMFEICEEVESGAKQRKGNNNLIY